METEERAHELTKKFEIEAKDLKTVKEGDYRITTDGHLIVGLSRTIPTIYYNY